VPYLAFKELVLQRLFAGACANTLKHAAVLGVVLDDAHHLVVVAAV
jgi:hypothetical protein